MDYQLKHKKMKNSNQKIFIFIMFLVNSFAYAQTFYDDVNDVPINNNITILGFLSILLIFSMVAKKRNRKKIN